MQDLAKLALEGVDDRRQASGIYEVVVGEEVEITSRRLQPFELSNHAQSLPNARSFVN